MYITAGNQTFQPIFISFIYQSSDQYFHKKQPQT